MNVQCETATRHGDGYAHIFGTCTGVIEQTNRNTGGGDMSDRLDHNEGGRRFVLGLLTGAVLGVGLGVLFAPKAGSELRNRLSERAGALANQAQEGYRKAAHNAGHWAEK